MEYASGLLHLKSNTDEKVKKWKDTIERRLEEATATLIDEEVEIESWFQLELNGEQYLLWYLRANSIEYVFKKSQELRHDIDKFHYKTMKEITGEGGITLASPLIDISGELVHNV